MLHKLALLYWLSTSLPFCMAVALGRCLSHSPAHCCDDNMHCQQDIVLLAVLSIAVHDRCHRLLQCTEIQIEELQYSWGLVHVELLPMPVLLVLQQRNTAES